MGSYLDFTLEVWSTVIHVYVCTEKHRQTHVGERVLLPSHHCLCACKRQLFYPQCQREPPCIFCHTGTRKAVGSTKLETLREKETERERGEIKQEIAVCVCVSAELCPRGLLHFLLLLFSSFLVSSKNQCLSSWDLSYCEILDVQSRQKRSSGEPKWWASERGTCSGFVSEKGSICWQL